MKELIQVIAQALVDAPELVSVREVNASHTTAYELQVVKHDLGKVIGKKGRTAQAIRVIMGAVAAKKKRGAILGIVDPYGAEAESDSHQHVLEL
jgi:predicted RNA-binding protein YlqC (UPF0109 family)